MHIQIEKLSYRAIIIAFHLVACFGTPLFAQNAANTESRMQAVLKLYGTVLPNGGFEVEQDAVDGPCTRLEDPNGDLSTVTKLEKGDVVIAVGGKSFITKRQLLDLLNENCNANNGVVRITVLDVRTGNSKEFLAHPDVVRMDVPKLDVLTEIAAILGKTIGQAPPVPIVPPTIDW